MLGPDDEKTRKAISLPAFILPRGPAARAWLLIGLAALILLLQFKLVADVRYVRRHTPPGPSACEASGGLPVWSSQRQNWDCVQRA